MWNGRFCCVALQNGRCSRAVLIEMQKQGFTNAKSLEGGILAWIKSLFACQAPQIG